MSLGQCFQILGAALRRTVSGHPGLQRRLRRVAYAAWRTPGISDLIAMLSEPYRVTRRDYRRWIRENDTLSETDILGIHDFVQRMHYRPVISVVMPVYNSDAALLRKAIDSVCAQLYPHWELCIADDASPQPEIWQVLQHYGGIDPRIKIVRRSTNGHICAASNSALALATGEYVALMDHDDIIPVHCLLEVAAELNVCPAAELIYSDEDMLDDGGNRFNPYFKPDWNPELLLGQNFVSHLSVYRRSLLMEIGGFRAGFEGSQDWDLALRASERIASEHIRHIPSVLYHWRQNGARASFSEATLQRCADAARRAVSDHLKRTGAQDAEVGNMPQIPFWVQVRRPLPAVPPLVSVVIAAHDRIEPLRACLHGLLCRTNYPRLEILIVTHESTARDVVAQLEELGADKRVRVLPVGGAPNPANLVNCAAAAATGEILLLLDEQIKVTAETWLAELVAQAIRPEVGAVGAKLLSGDGRVRHAGVILGAGADPGIAEYLHRQAPRTDSGYHGHLRIARNVSAVTAACCAVRRSVFAEVGGFDADHLPTAFADIDLCLKIRARGYQIVWTPLAELYWLSSPAREPATRPEDIACLRQQSAIMRQRWQPVLDSDPFYGPNFDLTSGHYELAARSRRRRPWQMAAGLESPRNDAPDSGDSSPRYVQPEDMYAWPAITRRRAS